MRVPPVSPPDFPPGWRATHYLRLPTTRTPWWDAPAGLPRADWARHLDLLRSPADAPGAAVLKRDSSGEVVGLRLPVGGRDLAVVVKRPRATRLGRRLVAPFRPSRSRRAWMRTRWLLDRGLATEVPLLLLERRRMGVVVEHLGVYGHVDGPTLAGADLGAMDDRDRRELLAGVGRCLRRVVELGLCHRDAKGTNWVISTENGRFFPVMLDCDGVRRDPLGLRRHQGLDRVLRALREHPQSRLDDEAAVRAGFVGSGAT